MTAREHIKAVLEATGLYQLEEGPASWELAAYGEGFAVLEDHFAQLLADLFPATAGRDRLSQWQTLLGFQPAQGTLQDARRVVASRLAVRPDSFTPSEVEAMLPGAGVEGLLLEGDESLTVVLGKLLGVTQAQAAQELNRLLPAHIPWQWDERVTWVALDAYASSFAQWDSLGWTWTQLDVITREDLENNFAQQEEM